MKQTASASEETKHSADVECIRIQGDFVYSCADDGKLKVWNKDLVLQKEIQAHDYAVYHILVVDDRLFTASIDATIKVWKLPSLELIDTITSHEESVRRLATNGDKLFSGDEKGDVKTHDLKTLAAQNKYEVVEEVWDLAAQGNQFFSVRDRGLAVTEIKEDETSKYAVVKSLQGRAPILLSKDHLYYCEFGTGLKINVHKNEPNEFPKVMDIAAHSMIITCLSGNTVGGAEKLASGGYDNTVNVWDIPSGNKAASCAVSSTPSALAMGSNGSVYAGLCDGSVIRLS